MTLTHYKREQIIWESPLPGNEKFLLLALNRFVDGDGKCFPGVEKLSEMCNIGVRTVVRLTESLTTKGAITKQPRTKENGKRNSNLYKIIFTGSPSVANPDDKQKHDSKPDAKLTHNQTPNAKLTHDSNPDAKDDRNRSNPDAKLTGDLSRVNGNNYQGFCLTVQTRANEENSAEEERGNHQLPEQITAEQPKQPTAEQASALPLQVNSSQLSLPNQFEGFEEKPVPMARENGSRSRKKVAVADFDPFREAYNRLKPRQWAVCIACNDERRKMLKRLVADHGDKSLEVFEQALMYAASDDYWSGWEKGCIETVFRKSRYSQWHELWQEKQVSPYPATQPASKRWMENGKVREDLLEFVARQFDTERTAARNNILRLNRSVDPNDKGILEGYCDDLEREQRKTPTQSALTAEESSRILQKQLREMTDATNKTASGPVRKAPATQHRRRNLCA